MTTISAQDAKDLSFLTRDEAAKVIIRLMEERDALKPWRDTVEEMLMICHGTISEDPRESVNKLIDWHVSVAMDPAVSSDAAALVEKGMGKARAIAEMVIEIVEPPEPNCSCHISPPCNDCVDNAFARELVGLARSALK